MWKSFLGSVLVSNYILLRTEEFICHKNVFKDLVCLKSLAIVYFKHGNGSSQRTSLNYRDKHMLKETALIETDRSHKSKIPK